MWFELVAAVGVTLVLTMSRIAAPVRATFDKIYHLALPAEEHTPIHCSQCMGMWCGWLVGALTAPTAAQAILLGPATSVVAYLTYSVIDRLEAR